MFRMLLALGLGLTLPMERAVAQEEAAAALARPGAEEGQFPPSDNVAECASILAVASTVSKNFVERDRLAEASGAWFASSGDLAISEGRLPPAEVWEEKVAHWAGRIGSVQALASHGDWMVFCSDLGRQYGLDTRFFAAHVEQPTEAAPAEGDGQGGDGAEAEASDETPPGGPEG